MANFATARTEYRKVTAEIIIGPTVHCLTLLVQKYPQSYKTIKCSARPDAEAKY